MSFSIRGGAIAATAVALAAAALPTAASANTVTGFGDRIQVRAFSGETNDVRLSIESGQITITERNAALTATGSCRLVAVGKAQCGPSTTRLQIALGDGDDRLEAQIPNVDTHVLGGSGDDMFFAQILGPSRVLWSGQEGVDTLDYGWKTAGVTVTLDTRDNDGAPLRGDRDDVRGDIERFLLTGFADSIQGNNSRQEIEGRGGADLLLGGGGNDVFLEGAAPSGPDVIDGQGGTDRVLYTERRDPVEVRLDGLANDGARGERDLIRNVEVLHGGHGDDILIGDDGPQELFGGPGSDWLEGRGGNDVLSGRDDVVKDTLYCGTGKDTVFTSGRDLAAACERKNPW